MIIWTLGLVLLLSACMVHSMLQPPSLYRHRIAVAQQKHPTNGRLPASIGARLTSVEDSPSGKKKKAAHPEAIEFPLLANDAFDLILPCLGTHSASSTTLAGSHVFVPGSTKQIRLKAQSCQTGEELASVEVNNSSNGFVATVFQPTPDALLTDYIMLTKTTSIVRVSYAGSKGAIITRDFTVDHAPTTESH